MMAVSLVVGTEAIRNEVGWQGKPGEVLIKSYFASDLVTIPRCSPWLSPVRGYEQLAVT